MMLNCQRFGCDKTEVICFSYPIKHTGPYCYDHGLLCLTGPNGWPQDSAERFMQAHARKRGGMIVRGLDHAKP